MVDVCVQVAVLHGYRRVDAAFAHNRTEAVVHSRNEPLDVAQLVVEAQSVALGLAEVEQLVDEVA